ncbi:hypothetical protein L2E82_48907 [Cichorium intybus]|uniref:Uncharacterized protein n=1 Tax=Cichorium intybus TaxID=13427 RepID=A0ACB8YZH8_CICIN|nr:hypothetical protein L2E82_48907 [Cichorium intybus]
MISAEGSQRNPNVRDMEIEEESTPTSPLSHNELPSLEGWGVILRLAFQSIGVVYGDIGTSPLYVYASTFSNGVKHEDDILGVLSIIIYTITLIPVIKYVMIVLRANDNGEGTHSPPPFIYFEF